MTFQSIPVFSFILAASAFGQDADGWHSLFNGKDLAGWSALIDKSAPGEFPPGQIAVRDGAIHMYADVPEGEAVPFGTIYHERPYSRFHLSFEYAWGKKKYVPRLKDLRDAGLLYHIAEPPRSAFGVWPASVECQIQEGDTGDIVLLETSALTWMNPAPGTAPAGQGDPGMLPENGGVASICHGFKYVGRYPEADKLEGWNTVEAIVQADASAVHKINGVVRARLAMTVDAKGMPLASGRIGVQLEGAEILYRNIRIRELPDPPSVPAPYASMSSVGGVSVGEMEIPVTNPGKSSVPLEMKLVGKDVASFRIERSDPNIAPPAVIKENSKSAVYQGSGPDILGPGENTSYRVRFRPTGKAGRYSAGLQIGPEGAGAFVVLQGLATDALEGENEPPLERVVHSLGIPLDVGGSDLKLGIDAAVIGGSKPAEIFRRAGEGAVRLTPLARYSPPGNYPFGWQATGDPAEERVVGALADSAKVADAHQRLFPPLADGGSSVEFSPGDAGFGLFIRAGKHTVGTNREKHPSKLANAVRVYPVKFLQGRRLTNALIVCFEEASNGDYQDSVFLMENAVIADAP